MQFPRDGWCFSSDPENVAHVKIPTQIQLRIAGEEARCNRPNNLQLPSPVEMCGACVIGQATRQFLVDLLQLPIYSFHQNAYPTTFGAP